ncbi:hypothetical protein APHAL10511_002163 [Amanita phalloides]|nr:hypothetical protein APHAL10511_002163 [Amanita phalloides]
MMAFLSRQLLLRQVNNIALSPGKLRALISLYHQGDNFITAENLSQRIDEAFIKNKPDLISSTETEVVGIKDLEDKLRSLRDAPKPTWSEEVTVRMRKVRAALYGVEGGREGHVQPGLETLLEELARLERDKEADEERGPEV